MIGAGEASALEEDAVERQDTIYSLTCVVQQVGSPLDTNFKGWNTFLAAYTFP
jgi:hypothetical protein